MKLLIHLANVMCWLLVPCALVLILSFVFGYSYWDAVQSSVFVMVYFLYAISIVPAYGIASDDYNQPMSFIKTN